jgi:hypothetical protein
MVALYGRPLGAVHRATRGERSTLAREGVALCDRIGGRLRWRPSRWVSSEAASGARRRRVRRPRQRRIPTPPCRSPSGRRRPARCSGRRGAVLGRQRLRAARGRDATRHLVPAPVPGLARWSRSTWATRTPAPARPTATVWCWGSGSDGAIGNGARTNAPPVQVGGPAARARPRHERREHLRGRPRRRHLVLGQQRVRRVAQPAGVREVLTPTRVAGLGPAVEVDTGQNHTCARLADGTVWCWGGSGPLGDGASPSVTRPCRCAGRRGRDGARRGAEPQLRPRRRRRRECWGSTGGGGGGARDGGAVALSAVTASRRATTPPAPRSPTASQCWGTNYQGSSSCPRRSAASTRPRRSRGVAGVTRGGARHSLSVRGAARRRCAAGARSASLRRPLRAAHRDRVPRDLRRSQPAAAARARPHGAGRLGRRGQRARWSTLPAPRDKRSTPRRAPCPTPRAGAPVEPLEARIARTTAVERAPRGHPRRSHRDAPSGACSTARRCRGLERSVLPSIAFDRRGACTSSTPISASGATPGPRRMSAASPSTRRLRHRRGAGAAVAVSHVSVDRRGERGGERRARELRDRRRGGHHALQPRPARVRVDVLAREGYGIFPGAPVRLVEYDDGACTVAPWTYENPFSLGVAIGFDGTEHPPRGLDARRAAATRWRSSTTAAASVCASATPRAPPTTGSAGCTGSAPAGAGVCAIDTNCDRIHLWTTRGEHVGNVGASELLGVSRPWLSAIEPGRRGRGLHRHRACAASPPPPTSPRACSSASAGCSARSGALRPLSPPHTAG